MGSMLDETPCREWMGARTTAGYGEYRPGGRRHKGVTRKTVYLHRWIWEQVNGPIPEGMHVMHRCDNPACFRLDHLRLGTRADNMADMAAKGRARNGPMMRDHCKHGHPYDEANTYYRKDRPGHRECRACRRGGQ